MQDGGKTKAQLIRELEEIRRRLAKTDRRNPDILFTGTDR